MTNIFLNKMNYHTHFIAAPSPSPDALFDWMVVLSFVVGISVGIKVLLSRRPSHGELATKKEVNTKLGEMESDINHRFDQVEHKISEERNASRLAQGKTHARIDKVLEATAEIKGELKHLTRSL